ncbi:hypothetical protein GCM10025868_39690 [Angustibacter aerolatus]|uniref:Uncharacterized protein n=1 Tax=Angustibacter aerolatus TaxID=1162965 RepID=A0ABQ6JN16_9ACTN|nr:hypothetical protein GCM10025868_39690 [Angustibacter aerolatus]
MVGEHALGDRAVDLQDRGGQPAEVGQVRVAAAEVVDRDLHAAVPQPGRLPRAAVVLVDEDLLGDLHDEPARVDVVLRERLQEVVREVRGAQAHR